MLFELLELLPDADLFTSVYDPTRWPVSLRDRVVNVSFLDRLPGAHRHYPKLLPFMNLAFESFDLSEYDLVVSSSHSCAKNVLHGQRRAAPLLLPHADAPRLGAAPPGRASWAPARPWRPG